LKGNKGSLFGIERSQHLQPSASFGNRLGLHGITKDIRTKFRMFGQDFLEPAWNCPITLRPPELANRDELRRQCSQILKTLVIYCAFNRDL
jgi:hypothetical protein